MKNSTFKRIAITIPIVAGAVIGVMAIMALFFRIHTVQEVVGTTAAAAIATATGAWAGLNIANAVERRQFDELSQRLDDSETLLKKIEDEYQELNHSNIREISFAFREFGDEPFYKLLADELDVFCNTRKTNLLDEFTELSHNIVRGLRIIIGNLCNITKWDTEAGKKNIIVDTCEASINMVKAIKGDLPHRNREITNLCEYIEGSFYFYKAFKEKDNDRKEDFERAAHLLKEYYSRMPKNLVSNDVIAYFGNFIAQCYSEIILIGINSQPVDFDVKKYIALTEENTRIALSGQRGPKLDPDIFLLAKKCTSEMYLKNAGLFYDRKSRVDNVNSDQSYKDLETALELLEIAVKKCEGEAYYATYYSLVSIFNRLIQIEIKGSIFGEDLPTEYKSDANIGKIKTYIEKIELYLNRIYVTRPAGPFYYDMKIIKEYYKAILPGIDSKVDRERINELYEIASILFGNETPDNYHKIARRIVDVIGDKVNTEVSDV